MSVVSVYHSLQISDFLASVVNLPSEVFFHDPSFFFRFLGLIVLAVVVHKLQHSGENNGFQTMWFLSNSIARSTCSYLYILYQSQIFIFAAFNRERLAIFLSWKCWLADVTTFGAHLRNCSWADVMYSSPLSMFADHLFLWWLRSCREWWNYGPKLHTNTQKSPYLKKIILKNQIKTMATYFWHRSTFVTSF